MNLPQILLIFEALAPQPDVQFSRKVPRLPDSGARRAANTMWPCGLMDKALVFGTKDCRFESCQGHNYSLCMPLPTKLHSTVPRGAKTENRDGPQILKQRAWLFSACLSQRTRIFCLCH